MKISQEAQSHANGKNARNVFVLYGIHRDTNDTSAHIIEALMDALDTTDAGIIEYYCNNVDKVSEDDFNEVLDIAIEEYVSEYEEEMGWGNKIISL